MPGPSTSRSSVGELIGRPHTRHRRPVPRRIEDIPVAANNSRFDSRARTSCLRSPSGRPGIIASGIVAPQTRRTAPRRRIGGSCGGFGKVKPDATGSGAKVRQPESPQEAHIPYTRRPAEVRYFASPSTTTNRHRPSVPGTGMPSLRWPHHSTTLNGSHHRGERHIGATPSAVAFASRLARARRTPRETARCGHPASRLPLPARLARSIHHSRRTSSRSLNRPIPSRPPQWEGRDARACQ